MIMIKTKASQIAARLTADESHGWTYEPQITAGGYVVAMFNAIGEFVGLI